MKRNSKVIAIIIAVAMVLSIIPVNTFAKKIILKNCTTKKVMAVGSSFKIVTNQSFVDLKFVSSTESIANVSDEGVIYAKKKGKAVITITSGSDSKKIKITVRKPVGYSISKKAGSYRRGTKTKIKVKNKYVVYYTTTNKFKASKKIKAKKSKTFTLKKDTTLRLYVAKAKTKLSTSKLNKTKKKYSNYNEYFYDIYHPCGGVLTPTPTSGEPEQTSVPGTTTDPSNPSVSGVPVPTATPSNQPTPFAGVVEGDDSIADFVAPAVGQFDTTDKDVSVPNNAIEITIPTVASGTRVDTTEYSISTKNKLTIYQPGTYVLRTQSKTTASDATVVVDATDDGTVHLVLDGVNLTSSTNTAPDSDTGLITVKKSVTRAVITLKEGTVNTLTDTGATGIDKDDGVSTTYTGGINCKKIPLTINGKGTLNITTTNGNGIKATNSLKIIDATISVKGSGNKAAGHNGISGKTEVVLENANLDVYSDGDALKTTLDETDIAEDPTLVDSGNIDINGGTIKLVSANGDALSSSRTLNLNPTKLETITKNEARSTADRSYKAIKAGKTINIPETAGTIIADTSATEYSDASNNYGDDAINCDGYIQITGGKLELTSADEGIHSDMGILISAGEIDIKKSKNGIEGADVSIYGGTVKVVSKNDGIAAGGGNEAVGVEQTGFIKGPSSITAGYQIIIAGGEVTVDFSENGIDANGNIRIIGGKTTINCAESEKDKAVTYDTVNGTCEIKDGTLVVAGITCENK